jgi:beta-phosphoglucomutase-like phosphatase (HAD superfamily)
MTNSHGIRAVVFDMDGVLIEARDWHYEALNRALGHFGWNISRADHLTTFNGLPTRDKLDILTRTQGLPRELHGFLNRLKQRYTRELIVTCCEPTYNHRYCLSKLAADGYALACASNSIRQTIVDILQLAALDTYLPLVVSNEDVTNAKPAPEIYLTACARLGLHPSQVLVVEDSEHGIAAARASGCHVLVVADPDDVTYDRVVAAIAHANAELAVLEVAA